MRKAAGVRFISKERLIRVTGPPRNPRDVKHVLNTVTPAPPDGYARGWKPPRHVHSERKSRRGERTIRCDRHLRCRSRLAFDRFSNLERRRHVCVYVSARGNSRVHSMKHRAAAWSV